MNSTGLFGEQNLQQQGEVEHLEVFPHLILSFDVRHVKLHSLVWRRADRSDDLQLQENETE
jgi:hypothetical protein